MTSNKDKRIGRVLKTVAYVVIPLAVGLGIGVGINFGREALVEHAAEARFEEFTAIQNKAVLDTGSYVDDLAVLSGKLRDQGHLDSAYGLLHASTTNDDWCAVSAYRSRVEPNFFVIHSEGFQILNGTPSQAIGACDALLDE